jgi:hypothetical protein
VYSLPAKKEVDPNKGEAAPSQAQSALLKIRISTITQFQKRAVKKKTLQAAHPMKRKFYGL